MNCMPSVGSLFGAARRNAEEKSFSHEQKIEKVKPGINCAIIHPTNYNFINYSCIYYRAVWSFAYGTFTREISIIHMDHHQA